MMTNNVYYHTICEYNRCTLADGDDFEFVESVRDRCIGMFMVNGEMEIVDADLPWVIGTKYVVTSQPFMLESKCRTIQKQRGNVDWICLHDNGI